MIASFLLIATTLSAGNAEFDKSAAEGAACITMQRFTRELCEKGLEEGLLCQEMLHAPAGYVSREEAEQKCKEFYLQKAKERFELECAEVRKRLSLDDSFVFPFTDADKKAIESKFPQAFKKERSEAVKKQARRIVSTMRPSEEEFESKAEDVLRSEMTSRIASNQDMPVFEENVEYISSQIVTPIIEGGKAERKRQGEYLMRARSEAVSPTRLAADLRARLEDNVSDRKTKETNAANVWGVFPSVLSQKLPEAVERRTIARLESAVRDEKIEISVDKVADIIITNPSTHVKVKESEKAFSELFKDSILSNSIVRVVGDAPIDEREEFKEFLLAHKSNTIICKAVDSVVRKDIMPKWRLARQEVAERMAKDVWPSLTNGTWYPPADLADEALSRSDYRKFIRSWRELRALESLAKAHEGKIVIEEASLKADEKISAAFELARVAIAGQNKIVDMSYDTVLGKVRDKKDSFLAKTPVLADIVKMLTEETISQWEEKRQSVLWPDGKMPENAEEQHVDLFPSVKKKIELLARKILEEMSQERPEDPKKQTPKEEEPPPEELEFTISVIKTSSGVEVKLLNGEKPVYERKVEAKQAPFKKAMQDVADKLGKDLLSLP